MFSQLSGEIQNLRGVSLNDRDNEELRTVRANDLADLVYEPLPQDSKLFFKKWRRRYIEGYLLHPDAIARASQRQPQEIIDHISAHHAINIGTRITTQENEPEALLDCRAKTIMSEHSQSIQSIFGVDKYKISQELTPQEIHEDFSILIRELMDKLQIT
ncbi:hypothetical protein VLF92_24440 [Pseudomonas chengduensis]